MKRDSLMITLETWNMLFVEKNLFVLVLFNLKVNLVLLSLKCSNFNVLKLLVKVNIFLLKYYYCQN